MRKHPFRFLIFLLLPGVGLFTKVYAQPFIFSAVDTDILNLSHGSVALVDLNDDGLMDILYTGNSKSGAPFLPRSAVAFNRSSGESSETTIPFAITDLSIETYLGNAYWSDYDLDGDFDFLLTGTTSAEKPYTSVSILFNNSAGIFTPVDAGFPGVHASTVRWADVDNDGDEDLFLAGETVSGESVAKIYRNDREAGFTEMDTPDFVARFGDAAFGDYDSDGDLDLVVSGTNSNGIFATRIYLNDGAGGFTESPVSLQGFAFASVEWADFDGDGDLDLATSGAEVTVADILHGKTILYRNDNGIFNRLDDEFEGVFYGDLTWGDYDLDGDLDLFIMGRTSLDGSHIGKIYRNEAGQFIEATGLVGTSTANAEWIDFDGDNDLDIFVLGRSFIGTPFSKLYRNDSRLINRPPQPPDGLSSTVNADNVTLSWNAGDDVETGIAGLMYNVSVGTAPGASDIFSARANTTTGKRWIFGPGNVGHNLSWTLHNLPIGLYFWSVQTIDNSYIGSEFSEEGQFSVSTGGKISTGTDDKVDLPQDFMLHPAYPNPMRTTTTLVFDIPVSTAVEITIFDILGKRIKTLVNGYLPGGIHRIDWEGDSESGHALGSGVFFVRMRAGEQVFTQKLVLLK